MKKKKKKGFNKIERFIFKSGIFMTILLLIGIVFTSASVSKMNIELQKMNKVRIVGIDKKLMVQMVKYSFKFFVFGF